MDSFLTTVKLIALTGRMEGISVTDVSGPEYIRCVTLRRNRQRKDAHRFL